MRLLHVMFACIFAHFLILLTGGAYNCVECQCLANATLADRCFIEENDVYTEVEQPLCKYIRSTALQRKITIRLPKAWLNYLKRLRALIRANVKMIIKQQRTNPKALVELRGAQTMKSQKRPRPRQSLPHISNARSIVMGESGSVKQNKSKAPHYDNYPTFPF
ncbi:uncharacterized protein DMAD_01779 [Drosophila madeirensis]|uniref:Secreted protein n=1 Tax=Drosophila madeirensis TaxID=30013 RepID=A0AAU9G2V1_DROMD